MVKQHQLSPEKYITTKARSLPIHRCYLTDNWKESGLVTAIVMRRHVNGNVTLGIYLVDLFCLGVKDTTYKFNTPESSITEDLNMSENTLREAEYNLVHNIIYAAHDFAMEFDIKPHKDFSVSKFILEEDDDNIPLIAIPVGDENGQPHLIVDSSFNYAPVLKKLEQHAGKGNFRFGLHDGFGDEDSELEDPEDEDDNE